MMSDLDHVVVERLLVVRVLPLLHLLLRERRCLVAWKLADLNHQVM